MGSESFEQLEQRYRAALARIGQANDTLAKLRGSVEPLDTASPPSISAELRAAENEAQQAFNAYIPVRDLYWSTRWGREGNPPKA